MVAVVVVDDALAQVPEDPANSAPVRGSPHGGQGSVLRRGGDAAGGCPISASRTRVELAPAELYRSDDDTDLLGAGIVAQTDADGRAVSWRAESQLKLSPVRPRIRTEVRRRHFHERKHG